MDKRASAVHAPFGGIGLRSIKTAVAATLTALIYALFRRNPTFACIGAVFGLGNDLESSVEAGGSRFMGTIIGGFWGLGLFWLEHAFFPGGNYFFRLPLLFLGIIALISLSVYFRWPEGVKTGSVLLCIILFDTPPGHVSYALGRMADTGVGVVIAIFVNQVLTRERLESRFIDKKAHEKAEGIKN